MNKYSKKKIFPIIIISFFFLILIIKGFNQSLIITNYTYYNSKVPSSFEGYKIVQISDLHCQNFGSNNETLIDTILSLSPDMIVLTGDMIDDEHSDISPVENLLKGLSGQIPIYAITGNHEFDSAAPYSDLLNLYHTYMVTDLDAQGIEIKKNNDSIHLQGLGGLETIIHCSYLLPEADTNKLNILLYHYTNHFEKLVDFNYDLILCGHTHGGIVRLPLIGGLFGNNNNLLPKYDKGMFQLGGSTMISSAGLGEASIPRFYNPPEIVCITLTSKEDTAK